MNSIPIQQRLNQISAPIAAVLPNPGVYQGTRIIHNTKKTGPEVKLYMPHNNQDTRHTEQRNNIKITKGKMANNI